MLKFLKSILMISLVLSLAARPAFSESMSEAASEAIKGIKAHYGGSLPKFMDVTIYEGRAQFSVQDPAKKENVDGFVFQNGKLNGPVPVKLFGNGKIEDNVFSLDEFDPSVLSALADETLKKTELEGGKVTHASIKRNLPFSKDVLLRVFVSGTRKNAFVDADLKGKIKKVTKT